MSSKNGNTYIQCIFLSVIISVLVISTIIIIFMQANVHLPRRFQEDDAHQVEDVKELDPNRAFLYHDQEDKSLVSDLRKKMYPPVYDVPYKLKGDKFEPSQGQGKVVRKLTDYKTGGFFVECGGGNGEYFSNTLFLEKHLGWSGLLVEADPSSVKATLKLHRRAWVAPFCMSLNTSAYETYFENRPGFLGRILPEKTFNSFLVRCYPFLTYLLALNVTRVDYFSLDVEGHEMEVLETVPFDRLDVTVLSVEFSKSRGGLIGVKDFMEQKGYRVVMEVPPDDLIFVKKDHPVQQKELLLL